MSQSWRSRAWQNLEPYRSPQQNIVIEAGPPTRHAKLRNGDEEEAFELLSAPWSQVPDDDNDEDLRTWSEHKTALSATTNKRDGCAGRYASLIAMALLMVFVLGGLGLLSSSVVQGQ